MTFLSVEMNNKVNVFLKMKNNIMQILNVTQIFKEDPMKSYIKVFVFLFLGLCLAIFIYPFLHELGHVIASLLLGLQCREFHLLPMPYVLCDMSQAREIDYYIVGSSGIIFPIISSQLLRPFYNKNIFIDFTVFIIEGISALACAISLISIFLLQFGYELKEDDITSVLIKANSSLLFTGIISALLSIGLVIIVILMLRQKTIHSLIASLEI